MIWRWYGTVDYRDMLSVQERLREAVIAHTGPETLCLVEHPRVVTTGRRGGGDLSGVRAAGIPIVQTGRGGFATWHGPGQLVGYPVVAIGRRGIAVKDMVRLLEEVLIDHCRSVGVPAVRDPDHPGVWVEGRKVASLGIHIRRGVVLHGFALNLVNDLADFDTFTPCGLEGVRMTSLAEHGCDRPPGQVAEEIAVRLLDALTRFETFVTRWRPLKAYSSAGEHRPDTAGVGGSNPPTPTPSLSSTMDSALNPRAPS